MCYSLNASQYTQFIIGDIWTCLYKAAPNPGAQSAMEQACASDDPNAVFEFSVDEGFASAECAHL